MRNLLTPLSIPVYEWTVQKSNGRNNYKQKTKIAQLDFSLAKLAIATSRAYLGKTSLLSYTFEGLAVYLKLLSTLNRSKGDLTANKDFINNLRDFSKTSRVGEIGQGLTYLFAQDILKYPIINDYGDYLKSENISTSGKTPDYVAFKNNNNAILIESKSGFDIFDETIEKKKLTEGEKQLTVGVNIASQLSNKPINIVNYYSVCTNVSSDDKSGKGSFISYMDPEFKETNPRPIPYSIKRHYATLFALSGNSKASELLLKDQWLTHEDIGVPTNIEGNVFYSTQGEYNFLPFGHPFIYIHKNAAKFLTHEKQEIENILFKQGKDQIYFNDGSLFDFKEIARG